MTVDPTREAEGKPSGDGGKYRARLDAALADAATWREAMVRRVAAAHGIDESDLDDVDDPDHLTLRATQLRQQRDAAHEAALDQALKAKGLEGEDRKLALDRLMGREPSPAPKLDTPQSRHASLRQIGMAPHRDDRNDVGGFGKERIQRAVEQQLRKKPGKRGG